MSRTTLYVARADGEMREEAEFENGSGTVSNLWRCLVEAYLPDLDFFDIFFREHLHPLWDLAYEERVNASDRVTLLTTFDKLLVGREDLGMVAGAFRMFCSRYGDRLHYWPRHSLIDQELLLDRLKDDPAVQAVGWHWTSVSENPWWVYAPDGEDGRPYNVITDTGHLWLNEEL